MGMTDTIAARATGSAPGAIGIIRISGPDAGYILDSIFMPHNPAYAGPRPHMLHHGTIRDGSGLFVDDVMIAFMPAPHSYTGEDCLEIFCHGGPAVLHSVLELVLVCGARPAAPGEFTKRAFLHGKMDLSQAEAVAELVNAPTRAALSLAGEKLSGALKDAVLELRSALERILVRLCLAVDFPEEEEACVSPEETREDVQKSLTVIKKLKKAGKRGRIWREGCRVMLAGRVNAGKSSLMNAVLGRSRALVTELPGTTRDFLEEYVDLDGLPVRLTDTAGFRGQEEKTDPVEKAGIEIAYGLLELVDLVLYIYEVHKGLDLEDLQLLRRIPSHVRCVLVGNKNDLLGDRSSPGLPSELAKQEHILVSAKTGDNIDSLLHRVRALLTVHSMEPGPGSMAPNARQTALLGRAEKSLESFAHELDQGLPVEVLATHIREAQDALAEITGFMGPDAILDKVFSNFCIGK